MEELEKVGGKTSPAFDFTALVELVSRFIHVFGSFFQRSVIVFTGGHTAQSAKSHQDRHDLSFHFFTRAFACRSSRPAPVDALLGRFSCTTGQLT